MLPFSGNRAELQPITVLTSRDVACSMWFLKRFQDLYIPRSYLTVVDVIYQKFLVNKLISWVICAKLPQKELTEVIRSTFNWTNFLRDSIALEK